MAIDGVTSLLAGSKSSTKEEEGTLHRQEENRSCGVDAEFDAEKRGRGCEIDVVSCAELFDPVNNEFLNKVGDAGDERGPGNRNSTEREPRTERANKKRGHANCDKRELPDARSNGEVVGLAEIQCVND